ncbi:MAG TPA: AMP-binding protein [Pseudonocardia sp.]|nr:AMP-binding protein [Pseudonocardia sp.]
MTEPEVGGAADAAEEHTLVDLVRRAAARWPDRVAWTFDEDGRELTFAEVDRRSDALAEVLAEAGVVAGDRVAVLLDNRPEFPLGWLAAAKLGAAMVAVNPRYRRHDATHVLAHSGARVVFTARRHAALLAEVAGATSVHNILDVESLPLPNSTPGRFSGPPAGLPLPNSTPGRFSSPPGGLSLPNSTPGRFSGPPGGLSLPNSTPGRPAPAPETAANVQYTSGTTGQPKGAILPHRYWSTLAYGLVQGFPRIGERDTILTAQAFHYVDPQWNVALGLASGARLVVLDRFHPTTFWAKVREHRVTWFYCLGLMPKLLLDQEPHPDDHAHQVRAISASAIPPNLHAALERRWGVPWFEAFGMTETGSDIRMTERDHDAHVGTGCLGRAVPGRELAILDEAGNPLQRETVGELAVRGVGLMHGYLGDPAATERAFRGGWFHTGDLARIDERGLVYYAGRTKDMIRRGGENVAAAEVEQVLLLHPDVQLVAVLARPDELRQEEVHAVVVPHAELPRPDELAEFCAARLAPFKVPRFWTMRARLPLTASERVAKAALRAELAADPEVRTYDRVTGDWVREATAPSG